MELVTNAVLLGLSTAPFCVLTCLPVILPWLLARDGGGLRPAGIETGLFLAGRLAAYLLVGAAAGAVGGAVSERLLGALVPVAYIFLAFALLLALKREARCGCKATAARKGTAFRLGFLTGINLCPPFLGAIAVVLKLADPWAGMLFFLVFYLVTSLFLIPLPWFGRLTRHPRIVTLARGATALVALLFLVQGFVLLPGIRYYRYHVPDPVLLALLPEATAVSVERHPYPVYRLTDDDGRTRGLAFVTDEVIPGIAGFNGPVPLLVLLRPDGTIGSFRYLAHREDEAYFVRVEAPKWIAQFAGRSVFDPLELGRDLDAVSGATVSATAVTRGLREAGRRVAADALGLTTIPATAAAPTTDPAWWLGAGFLLAAAAGYFLHRRRLRPLILVAAVLLLGWISHYFLSIRHFTRYLDGLTASGGLVLTATTALILVAIGTAFLVGRAYCGWLCPFGALSELLAWRARPRRRAAFPVGRPGPARALKFVILAALVGLALAGRESDWARGIEPFTPLFLLFAGSAVVLGYLVFLLFASLAVPRYFCRYLCPLGALLALFAQFAVFRWRLPHTGAGYCTACAPVCPVGALYLDPEGTLHRDPVECIECRQCLAACPRRGMEPGP